MLASSSNIYGNSDAGVLDELTPTAPANDYAVSKLAMEYVAKLWAARLPITIVRPFNYTGVGQSPLFLVPKIVDHFKRRAAFIELGNLDVVRDFSDVRDVVRWYRRLAEIPATGETYNFCSGVGVSLRGVIELLEELTQHQMEIRVNPAFVRANEVHQLIGSRTKLQAATGLSPQFTLRETLQWMLES